MRGDSVQEIGLENLHCVCAYVFSLGLCGPMVSCQEWMRLTTVDWCHLQPVRDHMMHPTGMRCLQGQDCGFYCKAKPHGISARTARFSRVSIFPLYSNFFNPHGANLSAERVASPVRDPASCPPAPLKTSRGACDIAENFSSPTSRKACFDHTLTNKGKQRDRRGCAPGS